MVILELYFGGDATIECSFLVDYGLLIRLTDLSFNALPVPINLIGNGSKSLYPIINSTSIYTVTLIVGRYIISISITPLSGITPFKGVILKSKLSFITKNSKSKFKGTLF